MTATTKKVGRKAMPPAVNVRMSQTSMSHLIRCRHQMELDLQRRVTDREALDKMVEAFYAE